MFQQNSHTKRRISSKLASASIGKLGQPVTPSRNRATQAAGLAHPRHSIYRNPWVRQRLMEFMGHSPSHQATATFLTESDGCQFDARQLRPPSELEWFLDRTGDIARSLADTESYLLHLDVEYVNFDSPVEAYLDPWRAFELQEPVVKVIESLLLEWGIQPLHLITGQGHHFVWRISRGSAAAARMAAISPAPELTVECMARVPPILAGQVQALEQEVFAAAALMIEYVAHCIKERAVPLSVLPVEITAVHVGPSATSQREIISLDISEYGDPLFTRMVRMPFTYYLKPWITGLAKSLGVDGEIPLICSIPLHEMDFRQAIKVRQVKADVLELAERAGVRIPLQEEGTNTLLDHYLASRLRRFHEFYYGSRHDPKERWPETYGQTPLNTLPGCVANLLEFPNDRLLKPAGMQLVTRCLLAQGWHPRHIAGLIRSKLEDPRFGWGVDWGVYEAGTRADFYTRLFAGLHLVGLDRLIDLNCTSTREKGFCALRPCLDCNLEPSRQTLLARLPYE